MILWTIQSLKAWQILRHTGILRTDPKMWENEGPLDAPGNVAHWARCYRWMADQMRARLRFRHELDSLPLWAWHQWDGAQKRRPDLRFREYRAIRARAVRLEFEIEDHLVVSSDYRIWDYLLCTGYVPLSEEDERDFESQVERHGLTPALKKRQENSWERIFDLDWEDEWWALPRARKSIQGTFWQLKLSQVRAHKILGRVG